MRLGKSLGLALAGCGLLAVAPSALADEDASLQGRIQELEKTVLELKSQLGAKEAAEPLSVQVEQYLQEQEKGAFWLDRNGKPLSKAIDSMWVTASIRVRPMWSKDLFHYTAGHGGYVGSGGYSGGYPYPKAKQGWPLGLYSPSADYDDEGWQTLQRTRLGIGANLHADVSAFIELDMNGTWGNASSYYANDSGFTQVPTLQQSYIEGLYTNQLNAETRIGRFEMSYGDEFVIGDRDFFQTGLAFDGIWLSKNYENHGFSVDFFATKLVDGYKNGSRPGANDSVYAMGLMGDWYGSEDKTGVPGGMQPYLIFVKDQNDDPGVSPPNTGGTRDVTTLGVYWFGDKATKDQGGIFWNADAAIQYFKQIHWATDSRVGYTMSNTKWTPKFWGQFAYASGDKDGFAGAGYNPLWMDVHGRYGYSDIFTFSNLVVYGIGAEVSPVENLSYGVEGRSMHIARTFKGGGGGKNLAWAFDFIVKHQYSENVDFEAAYSIVHWRDTLNTGNAYDVQVAYFNIVLGF